MFKTKLMSELCRSLTISRLAKMALWTKMSICFWEYA